MGNQVYANKMEISCKSADGKTICATPDVCMTPPQTPATPPGVPVPYPNTGMASDCTEGSATVKITDAEVMLKNKSYFKTSSGDEAGSAPMKGVISSVNTGKVYFNAWSMDVIIEGENAVRHLDLTTHNHASFVGNSPPFPYVDAMAMAEGGACHNDVNQEKKACEDCTPHKKGGRDPCDSLAPKPSVRGEGSKIAPVADKMADDAALDECLSARKCILQPYKRKTDGEGGKAIGCCPSQTGHHLVEKASFFEGGVQLGTFSSKGLEKYDEDMAPCVCAEGTSYNRGGTHELMHVFQKAQNEKAPGGTLPLGRGSKEFPHVTTYGQAKESAANAHSKVFPASGCDPECIKAQLDAYHNQCGIKDSTKIKAVSEGVEPRLDEAAAQAQADERASLVYSERIAGGITVE
jgi:hypothetical protein